MKTNGSQSSHIQVDRQTIETALDDEVASYPHLNNTTTTVVVATSEAARGCNEEKIGGGGSSSSTSPNGEMMIPKRKQHHSKFTHILYIFCDKKNFMKIFVKSIS